MGRETKIGLLVGMCFIMCFAIILANRGERAAAPATTGFEVTAVERTVPVPPIDRPRTNYAQHDARRPGSSRRDNQPGSDRGRRVDRREPQRRNAATGAPRREPQDAPDAGAGEGGWRTRKPLATRPSRVADAAMGRPTESSTRAVSDRDASPRPSPPGSSLQGPSLKGPSLKGPSLQANTAPAGGRVVASGDRAESLADQFSGALGTVLRPRETANRAGGDPVPTGAASAFERRRAEDPFSAPGGSTGRDGGLAERGEDNLRYGQRDDDGSNNVPRATTRRLEGSRQFTNRRPPVPAPRADTLAAGEQPFGQPTGPDERRDVQRWGRDSAGSGQRESPVQRTHVVAPGDSLTRIARQYYGKSDPQTIDAIFEANRGVMKSRDHIVIGKSLVLPSLASPSVLPATEWRLSNEKDTRRKVDAPVEATPRRQDEVRDRPVPAQPGQRPHPSVIATHVVKPGDRLVKIARAHYDRDDEATLAAIVAANADQVSDPNLLFVGLELKLPQLDDGGPVPTTADVRAMALPQRLRSPASQGAARADSTSSRRQRAARPETDTARRTVSGDQRAQPAGGETTAAPTWRWYTLQKGDVLSTVALEQLGTSRRWRELAELNKDIIPDPGAIRWGVKIRVPIDADAALSTDLDQQFAQRGTER